MIPSEGYDTSLKILSVCQYLLTLAYGEKSGNTSDGDTRLRWCPPSIAGEPVLPTPALMSAGWHEVGEGEAKPLDGSEPIDRFIAPESSAHQADLLRKGIKQILCREVMGNDDLIARTTEEPRDELRERCGPQYRGWVSYAERPPFERMVCILLIRDLSFLLTLVTAYASRCASRGKSQTLLLFAAVLFLHWSAPL